MSDDTLTSPIYRSNDGLLEIRKESNPAKSFAVVDVTDNHVEFFTTSVHAAESFVKGYDYCERLNRELIRTRP